MSNDLFRDLSNWNEAAATSHGDRELADRVLLACGWSVGPCPETPGRVRWQFGRNPRVSTWEPHHPHPVQRLDDALYQMPFGMRLEQVLLRDDGRYRVQVGDGHHHALGCHANLCLAFSMAAVRAHAFMAEIRARDEART